MQKGSGFTVQIEYIFKNPYKAITIIPQFLKDIHMELWSTDLADIYVVYLPEDIECIPIIDSMFVASIFHISNSYSAHCFGAFYLITGIFIINN